MAGSFERFTKRALKVLTLAQEEALRFGHNYMGTEHLLLGIAREGDGVAVRVLSNFGVSPEDMRQDVETRLIRGPRTRPGEIPLTRPAKKVIELAVDEARRLGHHYIGTEHLLLGLVREGEGIAADVLESRGVNLEKARSEVIKVLTQRGSRPQPQSRAENAGAPGQGSLWHRTSPPPSPSSVGVPPATGPVPSHYELLEAARTLSGASVRWSASAQATVRRAREEAARFNHNYIGTEHILLGLAGQPDTIAFRALDSSGVDLVKVRSAVEFIIGRGERQVVGEIGFTPRAKKVIELAAEEMRSLQHHYLGTEHLLLGLIREGEGIAAGVMESLGASLDRVRAGVLATLEGQASPEE